VAEQIQQPKPFNEQERQIISYIESEWFLKGSKPTPETLSSKFGMTSRAIGEFLNRVEVKKSIEARGIPPIEANDLSPEQIRLINEMLNVSDTRSERKKLADAGISAAKWAGWKQDPKVREYIRTRSESILGDAIPDAHLALVERVRTGDISALKFYYEMTGRYTGQNANLDPKVLLTRVFDIIAKHVTNPIVLQAIATEFQIMAGLDQAANMNTRTPVAGEIVQGSTVQDSPVARF
jgi:hypothetical protein